MPYTRVGGIASFGAELLKTLDLDPVYVMIDAVRLTQTQLASWLLAYGCFYHSGVACWITESGDFWGAMTHAAANPDNRFPRGTERRHFRGGAALNSVVDLRQHHPKPEDYITYISNGFSQQPVLFKEVFIRAQEPIGFGPWIAFKLADMLDRCGVRPVCFDGSEMFMFKDPAIGADLVWEEWFGPVRGFKVSDAKRRSIVVKKLVKEFSSFRAPPSFDRPVGLPEVETFLCKYKSHLNGRYPIGKDTKEVLHHLEGWGKLAEKMKRGLKDRIEEASPCASTIGA